MLKATDLRVGNLVILNGSIDTVTGIFNQLAEMDGMDYIIQNSEYLDYSLDKIEPIQLTPEILEKAGFQKDVSSDNEERETYSIQVSNTTSLYFDATNKEFKTWYLSHEWDNNHFQNDFWSHPLYLHQLQNLFKCLVGEDLEIDVKDFIVNK